MRQNVTLYARMEPLPNTETNLDNVEAGYYVNHFDGGHTAWVAHSNTATALTDPTVCNTLTLPSGQLFPFRVEASIPNQCTIEKPVSDIDLGTRKPVGESDVSGTAEILVRCHSKDSNYNIGLEPSNGNKLGQGELAQTGITERIAYQLKLNSSNGSKKRAAFQNHGLAFRSDASRRDRVFRASCRIAAARAVSGKAAAIWSARA